MALSPDGDILFSILLAYVRAIGGLANCLLEPLLTWFFGGEVMLYSISSVIRFRWLFFSKINVRESLLLNCPNFIVNAG